MAEEYKDNNAKEAGVSFKHTLNLPRTDFPIRSQASIDDPAMLIRWEKEDVYTKTFNIHQGAEKFILHDGPPYANGHMHLGHAYNNILKDIVAKSQRMMGKQVPVTPGWDCHGLPIESQVTKLHPTLKGAALKKACREYAQKWIEIQKKERKSFGVFMDWNRPYSTMDFEYEANTLRALGEFVAGGFIERKNKTVPWCASCQTVLATAEIEYEERKDPSIYVLFPLTPDTIITAFPSLNGKEVNLLIWTTTPWTLPLNRAVLLKPGAVYVIFEHNGTYICIGKESIEQVSFLIKTPIIPILEFVSDNLVLQKAFAQHPFISSLIIPLILDESVSLKEGTAFVHCAPGVGPEDYTIGLKNELEIYSPLSADGKYTEPIQPEELRGMSTQDGQIWVIKKLVEKERLFFKTSITHPYPHCWRCHNGLIFRATKQWFCDLSKHHLKEQALAAADTIATLPEKSIAHLKATMEGRLEWCLSRQREWGVPIPALLCVHCDNAYIAQDMVQAVADRVARHGIEFWDEVTVEQLLAPDFVYHQGIEYWEPLALEIQTIKEKFSCPSCHGTAFKKEQDILDVWFDSGISHYAVLKSNTDLAFPADVYLEGKDQHRGWFQSSLLTSMVLHQQPSTKMLITHGYTVDAKGRKMSKSLGNVIAPQEIMDKIGTDGMRLWASSIDCSGEAVISPLLLQNVQEVFRKIRNTCRFLVSNLYDFNIDTDAIALSDLPLIDQYVLQELFQFNHYMIKTYASYNFTALFHTLADYGAVNLSAFYLDIVKDRLYVSAAQGKERRSAQTACYYILDTLVKLMAPIFSFTAEQLSDHYQKNKTDSIHLQQFNRLEGVWDTLAQKITMTRPGTDSLLAGGGDIDSLLTIDAITFNADHQKRWITIKNIRSALLKAIEIQREKGAIKHSLEAHIIAYFDDKVLFAPILHSFFAELMANNETPELFFKDLVIVSVFDIVTKKDGLSPTPCEGFYVTVAKAPGVKCPRCWQWHTNDHVHNVCNRCNHIVKQIAMQS